MVYPSRFTPLRETGYEAKWEMGHSTALEMAPCYVISRLTPTHSAQLNHDTPFTKDLRQRRSFPYHTTLAAERTSFHDVPPSLNRSLYRRYLGLGHASPLSIRVRTPFPWYTHRCTRSVGKKSLPVPTDNHRVFLFSSLAWKAR